MPSSNALIRWNPHPNTEVAMPESSRPRGGRWDLILRALLSPSPGRTLDRVYTSLGDVLQTHANRTAHTLGLGPRVVARNIKSYFGNAEERVQRLERLRIVVPPKLKKNCLKLMKHTLPKEAANTQCQAFKEIVDLVTLLPGLRVLFLQTKVLDNATVLTINSVWDRPAGAPDKDWSFWQILAATCLTDTRISIILEGSSIADLSHCRPEILSVIEKLLIEHDCCGSSEYSSALCIRYLAGVLDLREFWLDLGSIHAYVANKLFRLGAQVLNDIGADIPALGVIAEPEAAFDYDGVDFLAQTLLEGLSGWFAKIDPEQWYAQPWYESFTIFLQLLRRVDPELQKSCHSHRIVPRTPLKIFCQPCVGIPQYM
ncbi:hypothetical protein K438DRAFT_1262063 [Mycena galopus ATCC 62051]|nr:hypothetical protein K438DRAFT_1262063 [Mycena galopus ATCC 62051]